MKKKEVYVEEKNNCKKCGMPLSKKGDCPLGHETEVDGYELRKILP